MTSSPSANGSPKSVDLDTVYVSTDLLVANDWNPNQQSDVVRQAERESILMFGFVDPITVRAHPTEEGKYEIIDGEHRWQMAREIGLEQVPIIPLDLSDADARKLTVVLNETRGDADVVLLSQLLANIKEMTDEDTFPAALPYTAGELQHLLALSAQNWDDYARTLTNDAPPVLSTLVEIVLALDTKTADRVQKWLTILRNEWKMAEASHTDVIVEAIKRAALEANQGKKKPAAA